LLAEQSSTTDTAMTTETKVQDPWQFDVRIRQRNLKSGALVEKDLQKYLTALVDLDAQVESFETPQPALDLPDDVDDEEDEDEVAAVEAAP
jgi:hypothetical protein